MLKMRNFKNISLQHQPAPGRLMAVFPVGVLKSAVYWAFLCDCGNTGVVRIDHFLCTDGRGTLSCGCLLRENGRKMGLKYGSLNYPNIKGKSKPFLLGHSGFCGSANGHFTHGLSRSSSHRSWIAMIQRCTNPNGPSWKHYGGANPPVQVCDHWLNSFEAFFEDTGVRPPRTSLGRFLDSGDYKPGNCEWQTDAEQKAEQRGKRAMLALRKYHNSLKVAA